MLYVIKCPLRWGGKEGKKEEGRGDGKRMSTAKGRVELLSDPCTRCFLIVSGAML